MTSNSLVCNSKAAATAALETIAGTLPKGVQRDGANIKEIKAACAYRFFIM
ncbi:MAG: hypothetical protein LBH43_14795 [Treponema sp.]|jgi:hypothetical protein|nr:hypothetical protein [Treponema sp.]